MSLDEETLERVARDGEMDYAKWPAIIEPLLERLNHIIYHEFQMPRPFPVINHPLLPPLISDPSQETTSPAIRPPLQTQQNGAQVPVTPVRNLPPVPPFHSPATSTSQVPDSAPPSQALPTSSPLPPVLDQLHTSITATLRNTFSQNPPHTIQRLAELILRPNTHYKTLPAYLRAIDRVVAVSSSANIFPLPHAQPLPNSVIDSSLLNGHGEDSGPNTGTGSGGGGILWDNRKGADAGLGSDESLGGALLTPIPWLKNGRSIHNSESGLGSSDSGFSSSLDADSNSDMLSDISSSLVPERQDGAVTQGELIRQEQEAGVVPVTSTISRLIPGSEDIDSVEEDEIPHARGPDLLGTVDMGLVAGKREQVSIATGEGESRSVDVNDAQDVLSHGDEMVVDSTSEGKDTDKMKEQDKAESAGDGDIVLTDAEGKRDEQK